MCYVPLQIGSLKMNISLTPEMENYVNLKVQSGRYSTPGEVIREGLRLLELQDSKLPSFNNRDELDAMLQAGIESMECGDLVDGKQAFARIRERARQRG